MAADQTERKADPSRPETETRHPPTFDTNVLFGTRREIILVHNGEPYRLRQTQSGKLILTK